MCVRAKGATKKRSTRTVVIRVEMFKQLLYVSARSRVCLLSNLFLMVDNFSLERCEGVLVEESRAPKALRCLGDVGNVNGSCSSFFFHVDVPNSQYSKCSVVLFFLFRWCHRWTCRRRCLSYRHSSSQTTLDLFFEKRQDPTDALRFHILQN